jgi:hypothetical protein
MKLDESDLAEKVLCTTPGTNEDRRRGTPNSGWCCKLEEDFAEVR